MFALLDLIIYPCCFLATLFFVKINTLELFLTCFCYQLIWWTVFQNSLKADFLVSLHHWQNEKGEKRGDEQSSLTASVLIKVGNFRLYFHPTNEVVPTDECRLNKRIILTIITPCQIRMLPRRFVNTYPGYIVPRNTFAHINPNKQTYIVPQTI